MADLAPLTPAATRAVGCWFPVSPRCAPSCVARVWHRADGGTCGFFAPRGTAAGDHGSGPECPIARSVRTTDRAASRKRVLRDPGVNGGGSPLVPHALNPRLDEAGRPRSIPPAVGATARAPVGLQDAGHGDPAVLADRAAGWGPGGSPQPQPAEREGRDGAGAPSPLISYSPIRQRWRSAPTAWRAWPLARRVRSCVCRSPPCQATWLGLAPPRATLRQGVRGDADSRGRASP